MNVMNVRAARLRDRVASKSRKRPFIAGRPVKLIVTKRTKRVVGYIASSKMDGLLPWASQLERDHLRKLDIDNTVAAFYVQPETIEYVMGGKNHRYTPDVRVEYADGEVHMVEVKYFDDAMHPQNRRAFDIFRQTYAKRNITFRVATEVTIRQKVNLENIQAVRYLRDHKPDRRLSLQVRQLFDRAPPKTLGELETALGVPEDDRFQLLAMAARGHFSLDLSAAANANTLVYPSPIDPAH